MTRPLDQTGQSLAAENVALAHSLAFLWFKRNPDVPVDELKSAALYALVYAASRFDPSLGIPFGPYASKGIVRGLIRTVRSWRREWYVTPADSRDGELIEPEARPAPDPFSAADVAMMLRRLEAILPERAWQMFIARHVQQLDNRAMAHQFGVSRQRIDQQLAMARTTARRCMPEFATA